jgi:hypothetical protein
VADAIEDERVFEILAIRNRTDRDGLRDDGPLTDLTDRFDQGPRKRVFHPEKQPDARNF